MKLSWKTVKKRVSDLVPAAKNPRKISPERQRRLINSLEKFNLVDIPAVDLDGTILSGNQRVTVLGMIGRGAEEIDVRMPNRALTLDERREYMLRANSHDGEWDFDILEAEYGDLDLDEFDIKLPEFDSDEIDRPAPQAITKDAPEPEKKWFIYIDCVNEREAMKMYNELSDRGFETKIVN